MPECGGQPTNRAACELGDLSLRGFLVHDLLSGVWRWRHVAGQTKRAARGGLITAARKRAYLPFALDVPRSRAARGLIPNLGKQC